MKKNLRMWNFTFWKYRWHTICGLKNAVVRIKHVFYDSRWGEQRSNDCLEMNLITIHGFSPNTVSKKGQGQRGSGKQF